MFLTPHHFQQWDRFYEDLIARRMRIPEPRGWGVSEIKINEDALANGEFILTRCSGVLPDGFFVDLPDRDVPPKSRQIGASFSPKQDSLGVYLGSPLVKPGSPSIKMDGAASERPSRYVRKAASVPDAELLVPITFLVIAATVVIYGLTARPLALRLGVAEDG